MIIMVYYLWASYTGGDPSFGVLIGSVAECFVEAFLILSSIPSAED